MLAGSLLVALTATYGEYVTNGGLAIQLTVMAVTSILLVWAATPHHLRLAASGFIACASASAVAALGQAIGVVPEELFQLEGAEMHRPSGFHPEPDWLGLYCAAAIVLLFVYPFRNRVRVPLILLNVFGVAFASARAAILGLLVVLTLAALAWVGGNRGQKRSNLRLKLPVAALVASVTAFAFLQPVAMELLLERIGGAINPMERDHAVEVRFYQVDGLVAMGEDAPWYGFGLSSAGRVSGYGDIVYSGDVTGSTASNWLLGLWVDAQALAIPLILVLVYLSMLGRKEYGGRGLLALILVNSLFSNALFFPITWFAIALALTRVPRPSALSTRRKARPRPLLNEERRQMIRRQVEARQAAPQSSRTPAPQ
ncbi:O-antigen ligase family protein [Crystallibacter degradans]|uniref:O-antigen ligase family protein n=1 Tax=Crystallibacter degradans TaxID=2726743 RepID=UPI001472785E|nr:O-antigen ligase family protein [Arthrobacter sp. SF27]NMR28123.1 hypothetical protein [Arthrobacter sp. SF27]